MKSRYDKTFNQLSKSDRDKIVEYAKQIAIENYKENAIKLDLSHNIELYAAFGLMLNEVDGYGEKRIKARLKWLNDTLEEIHKTYELAETDTGWICQQKMLDRGFDVAQWVKEWEKTAE